jgi:CrcB-like protein, Camphor Resistance (CrcB)
LAHTAKQKPKSRGIHAQILLVGAGGFLGTVSRYVLGGWVHHVLTNTSFPYGTLVVNAIGCFLIGLLSGLAESRAFFGPEARLFFFIGILGWRECKFAFIEAARSEAMLSTSA